MKKCEKQYKWIDGRRRRIYSKKEMIKEINKNQDVVFHNDGWIISHSAGH